MARAREFILLAAASVAGCASTGDNLQRETARAIGGDVAPKQVSVSAVDLGVSQVNKLRTFVPPGTEWMINDFGMSPAIRAGNQIWLSGVTVSPKEGQTFEAALDQAFSTITTILESADLTWSNVVDITSFHIDIDAQRDVFLKVKGKYVTARPYPAWTAVGVNRLWLPTIVAEVKIVAVVPN